jgi:hypothetical protein
MVYAAVIEARKAAEANSHRVREAVRLGLQLKRETEERKATQKQAHVLEQIERETIHQKGLRS